MYAHRAMMVNIWPEYVYDGPPSEVHLCEVYLPVRYITYTGELQVVTVECAQFKLHSSSCTAGSSGRPDAAQMYLSCLPQALPMQIPCSSLFTLCCIVVFTMWCIVVSRSPHIVVHRYASWCQMVRTLLSTAAAWPHKCSGR